MDGYEYFRGEVQSRHRLAKVEDKRKAEKENSKSPLKTSRNNVKKEEFDE